MSHYLLLLFYVNPYRFIRFFLYVLLLLQVIMIILFFSLSFNGVKSIYILNVIKTYAKNTYVFHRFKTNRNRIPLSL